MKVKDLIKELKEFDENHDVHMSIGLYSTPVDHLAMRVFVESSSVMRNVITIEGNKEWNDLLNNR